MWQWKYWNNDKWEIPNDQETESEHSHCDSCFKSKCQFKNTSLRRACPLMSCPLLCGARFHSCKEVDHKEVCNNEMVPCINANYGCSRVMRRSERRHHLTSCPASIVYCTMEWNRWPVFSKERQERVPFAQKNLHARHGQLDVALAMRDQRVLYGAMKAPMRVRRSLRNRLTERFPAVPLRHETSSFVESVQEDGVDAASVLDLDGQPVGQVSEDQPVLPDSSMFVLFHKDEIPLSDSGTVGSTTMWKLGKDSGNGDSSCDNLLPVAEASEIRDVDGVFKRDIPDCVKCDIDTVMNHSFVEPFRNFNDNTRTNDESFSSDLRVDEVGKQKRIEQPISVSDSAVGMTIQHDQTELSTTVDTASDLRTVSDECLVEFGSVLAKGIEMASNFISAGRTESSDIMEELSVTGRRCEKPCQTKCNVLSPITCNDRKINNGEDLCTDRNFDQTLNCETVVMDDLKNKDSFNREVCDTSSASSKTDFETHSDVNWSKETSSNADSELLYPAMCDKDVASSNNVVASVDFTDDRSRQIQSSDSVSGDVTAEKHTDIGDAPDSRLLLEIDFSGALNFQKHSMCIPQSIGSISGPGTFMVDFANGYHGLPDTIDPVPPPTNPPPLTLQEILALDLNLESITRYQAKPRSMYTFLCAQDFRRDEYEGHFRNVHSEIHGGLSGWIEGRCPLACYGCTFSVRRLNPKNGTVVYNSAVESFGVQPDSWLCKLKTQNLEDAFEESKFEETETIPQFLKSDSLLSTALSRESCKTEPHLSEPALDASVGTNSKVKLSDNPASSDDNVSEENSDVKLKCFSSKNGEQEYENDILRILPFEMLQHIAKCLDSFSLCNLAMTCHYLRDVCKSLVEDRGVVIQEWEKIQLGNHSTWQVAYQRWRFSTAFTPIDSWRFEDCESISEHLKTCPFNILAEPRNLPVQLCFTIDGSFRNPETANILKRMYPDFDPKSVTSEENLSLAIQDEQHLYINGIGENGFSPYNKVLKEFAEVHSNHFVNCEESDT